jgi:hypothetical protein
MYNNKRAADMTPAEKIEAIQSQTLPGQLRPDAKPCGKPYDPGNWANPGGGQSLKEWLKDPPPDVLEMIAQQDPVLFASLREQKAKSAAAAFMSARPDYLNTDANYEAIMRRMARVHLGQPFTTSEQAEDALVDAGFFTVDNITRTFKALLATGDLEVKRGTVKKLNRQELREIAIAIETRGAEFALLDYLSCALGGLPNDLESPDDLMVRHADLMNEAVLFIWPESRPSFINSPEWVKWFFAKRRDRVGVLTLAIMDQLWAEWLSTPAAQRSTAPVETITPVTVAAPDYSEMSSEQIAKLFEDTQRAARIDRARQVR